MLFIILHHYSVHSQWQFPVGTYSFRVLFIQALAIFGKAGILLFLLITGYFINDIGINLKKVRDLWLTITFYTVIIYLSATMFSSAMAFSWKELITNLLPVTTVRYGFMTSYFIVSLFFPCLKKILEVLTIKQKIYLLLILFYYIYIGNLVTFILFFRVIVPVSDIGIFIFIIILGNTIKEMQNKIERIKSFYFIVLIILSTAIMIGSLYIIGKNNVIEETVNYPLNLFTSSYSLTILIFSISLFILFTRIKSMYNKRINYVAKTTMGIYLIHDNYLIRPLLWTKILNTNRYYSSKAIFLIAMSTVAFIFIVCMIVELIRIKLFKQVSLRLQSK